MSAGEALAQGSVQLGLQLAPEALERLMQYVALLQKWNAVYNLTAVSGAPDIVTQHLLDSLAVLPHIAPETALDVGSGAGLPGIPLAIASRDARWTLLDANQKKTAFLRQAVIELRLDNVQVVCERVEKWRPGVLFDVVISRAFADVTRFLQLAGPLCSEQGVVAAMKGAYHESDFGRPASGFSVRCVIPLAVPGLSAARHLVLLTRAPHAT